MKSRKFISAVVVFAVLGLTTQSSFAKFQGGNVVPAVNRSPAVDQPIQAPATSPTGAPISSEPVAVAVEPAPAAPSEEPVAATTETPAPETATRTVASTQPATPVEAPSDALPQDDKITDQTRDLTLGEMSELVFNFSADVEGANPKTTAVLRGKIFQACTDYLEIKNVKSKDQSGFRIVDRDGRASQCIADKKKAGQTCRTNRCVSLSSLDGAKFNMTDLGDVRIGLLHSDPEQDTDKDVVEDFDESNDRFTHVSKATLDRQARLRKAEQKKNQIEALREQVSSCKRDADELSTARDALDLLDKLANLDSAEYERLDKQLSRSELALLAKRVKKVKINEDEDVDDLREDLEAYAEAHPDKSETIAAYIKELGDRYLEKNGNDPAAYDRASEIYGSIADLPEISDESVARAETLQNKASVQQLQVMATAGQMDPFTFIPRYQTLMTSLASDLRSKCQYVQGQGYGSDCTDARNTYTTAMQLPQKVQQINYQNSMLQVQAMQQAYNAMIPASTNPSMPGFQANGNMNF